MWGMRRSSFWVPQSVTTHRERHPSCDTFWPPSYQSQMAVNQSIELTNNWFTRCFSGVCLCVIYTACGSINAHDGLIPEEDSSNLSWCWETSKVSVLNVHWFLLWAFCFDAFSITHNHLSSPRKFSFGHGYDQRNQSIPLHILQIIDSFRFIN